MNRREFIAGLGGAAAWPLAARAQPGDRLRRIGVLMAGDENDPIWKPRLSALTQALADLGWTDGRNVRLDLRSGNERKPIDRRYVVSGRRQYDRRAMRGRECIQHDDKTASGLAPKGNDGRFDLYVAMNGRNDWHDLE
jgi:hypothetical protein